MSVKLTDKASIPAVLKEMTLEEKARLTNGASPFGTYPIPRLGIPSATLLDGAPGINFSQLYSQLAYLYLKEEQERSGPTVSGMESLGATRELTNQLEQIGEIREESLSPALKKTYDYIQNHLKSISMDQVKPTCFPAGMLLGATWNPDMPYACGEACGREFDAFHLDVMLGPNVNIHRDPLNGRLFEGYSEDPYLAKKMAPSFIKGAQSTGVMAEPKHFAANNQETARMNGEQHIPMRALQEIYFPGFKACVQEGKAKTIMSAYNRINGTACALNPWLLTQTLREEWGFQGLVVSDWGAVYDQVEALKAGNDLEMPVNASVQRVIDAVQSGELPEEALDRTLSHFLEALLDMPVMKGRKYKTVDHAHSAKAAYEAACEGIVLLKNNGVLPLSKAGKTSFFGQKSLHFLDYGAGSAAIPGSWTTSLTQTAAQKCGESQVLFQKIDSDTQAVVITAHAKGQEGKDRPAMDLEPEDKAMLLQTVQKAKAAGKPVVVILNVSGPVDMREYLEDADAILCVFLPGSEGAHAAADILYGDVNPSGKLPITFPLSYQDCPTYGNFPGYGSEVWYGEGIYVGYRHYDWKNVKPAFAFGHGLSYTTFQLSNLQYLQDTLYLDDNIPAKFQVTVTNTGPCEGKEVVQLYLSHPGSTLPKPVKELKGFQKVQVAPGESTVVTFSLSKEDLESYDPWLKEFTAEPGTYQIHIGTASDHIVLTGEIRAKGKNPYGFGPNATAGKVLGDPRCADLYRKILGDKVPYEAHQMTLVYSPDRPLDLVLQRMSNAAFSSPEEKQSLIQAFYQAIEDLEM